MMDQRLHDDCGESVVELPGSAAGQPLRAGRRKTQIRFAEVACPPELRTLSLADALTAQFESMLGVLSPALRRSVPAGLLAFDQGARLYPPARGRRFTRLSDQVADRYFRAVLTSRRGGLGVALQRLKALVVMCYYELPEVKQQLGYAPDQYIAAVSKRRLATYGAEIRLGAAALFHTAGGSDDPGQAPAEEASQQ
jgi:hypothetical protein